MRTCADLHAAIAASAPAARATLCRVMRTVIATRYVTPLREGGSLPGLVEADDDGLYVVKFRGAGQGPRALVAEWLAGELGAGDRAARAGPRRRSRSTRPSATPSRTRRSTTSSRASGGLNLGMDFLPGALAFNPAAATASRRDRPGRSRPTSSGSMPS